MSRHWYGKDYENDTRHMELMTEVNDLLRRLGPASCEIAFVYSFAGASHVWPRPWREVWRAYWTFAQQMVEGEHIPFLTFFAESLRECLERHPEVRVIVLNEFFPIPPAEVELLEEWLAGGAGGRRIVYIGGRDGYCWEGPLYTDFRMRPPEMSRLVGIDPEQPVRRIHPDPETRVTYMGNDGTNAFAGEEFLFSPPVVGVPGFLREGAPDALYVLRDEENVPLVTRRRVSGGGEAWFLAFPLEGSIDEFPFGSLFRELLGTAAAFGSKPYVEQASPGVLFNFTANGYLVVVNCTKRAAQLGLSTAVRAWDVSAEAYVATLQTVELEPLAIRLFRLLEEGRRVLDVRKPVLVEELREVRDGVEFAGRLHSGASVLLSARPDRVEVNGSPCAPDLREGPSGTWELFPPVSPGDRCRITVHFREAGAG